VPLIGFFYEAGRRSAFDSIRSLSPPHGRYVARRWGESVRPCRLYDSEALAIDVLALDGECTVPGMQASLRPSHVRAQLNSWRGGYEALESGATWRLSPCYRMMLHELA
jgi:hypothetical protein